MKSSSQISQNKFSPFGVTLANRNYNSSDYRYGFQNQEKDDELKGEGNSVNFTYRMHDPRLGRFFAVDPLVSSYHHISPYSFSENRVIDHLELEGLEKYIYSKYQNEITGETKFAILVDYDAEHEVVMKVNTVHKEKKFGNIVLFKEGEFSVDQSSSLVELGVYIDDPIIYQEFFDDKDFQKLYKKTFDNKSNRSGWGIRLYGDGGPSEGRKAKSSISLDWKEIEWIFFNVKASASKPKLEKPSAGKATFDKAGEEIKKMDTYHDDGGGGGSSDGDKVKKDYSTNSNDSIIVEEGRSWPSGNKLVTKQHADSAKAGRDANQNNSRTYEIPNSADK